MGTTSAIWHRPQSCLLQRGLDLEASKIEGTVLDLGLGASKIEIVLGLSSSMRGPGWAPVNRELILEAGDGVQPAQLANARTFIGDYSSSPHNFVGSSMKPLGYCCRSHKFKAADETSSEPSLYTLHFYAILNILAIIALLSVIC